MPYETIFRPAEVFLEHNGVKVYHVYKDDDFNDIVREYWYDNKPDSSDSGGFDVRSLAKKLEIKNPDFSVEGKKSILRAGIEAGLIEAPLREDDEDDDET